MSSFNSYNVDVTGQPERPRREKRLVRFVHPSGLTAHELILARQKELDAASIACGVRPLRSTAEEIGFNAPKLLSVQRDRTQGALRDSIYLDRRRRVLDLSQSRMTLDISPAQYVENILSTPRPSGGSIFGEGDRPLRYPQVRCMRVPFEVGEENGREKHQAFRNKGKDGEVKMAVSHQFPSEKEMETNDCPALESLGIAMSVHKKVEGWYKEIMTGDHLYRSNELFLEIKMRELLGDAWPHRSSEPDVVRAAVCCDMLGRLLELSPSTKQLGLRLLDELIVAIFQPRIASRPQTRDSSAEDFGKMGQEGKMSGKYHVDSSACQTVEEGEEQNEMPDAHGPSNRPRCLEEWGEPYFVTVFKLREKVKELQADVAALRVKCQGDDSEEARNGKMERLMSKLSGKATKRCLMCWKQWHKKRAILRKIRKSLHVRFRLRWRPICFYKWLMTVEENKRQRQEQKCSMMKWEKDYQREIETERVEHAIQEGIRAAVSLQRDTNYVA